MPEARDVYSYQIQFGTAGIETVRSADDALDRLGRSGRAAGKGLDDAGRAAGGARDASGRAGQAMFQLAAVMDDARFGARGLTNQMVPLATALLGFGPIGVGVGVALQTLTAVFARQIDEMLEWAGILDENLVKGRQQKEEVEERTASLEALTGATKDQADAEKGWTDAIQGVRDALGDRAVDDALRQVIGRVPQLTAQIDDLNRQIRSYEDRIAAIRGQPFITDADAGAVDLYRRQVAALNDRLAELGAEQAKRATDRLAALREQLAKGGDAARGVIDSIAALRGENDKLVESLREGQEQAAEALAKSTEEAKEAAEAQEVLNLSLTRQGEILEEASGATHARREAEEDWIATLSESTEQVIKAREAEARAIAAIEEGRLDLAAAARREAEEAARAAEAIAEAAAKKAEAEEEAARRRIEAIDEVRRQAELAEVGAAARRVVEAFGPQLEGRIGGLLQQGLLRGATVGQAAGAVEGQLVDFLLRSGVGLEAANEAAGQLVQEQAAGFQAMLNAFEAQRQINLDGIRNSVIARRLFDAYQAQFRQMAIIQHNNAGRW